MDLTIDLDTGGVIRSYGAIVLPRMLPEDPSFIRPRWDEERMPVLEVSVVSQTWKGIARMLKNDISIDLLQIFGEVYTHFQRGEYPQTILLASTLVERWYASIRDQAIGLEQLRKLRRGYRLVDILRILDKEALVEKEVVSKLYQLWQLRSEVVHTFRHVTKAEAESALTAAVGILQSLKA